MVVDYVLPCVSIIHPQRIIMSQRITKARLQHRVDIINSMLGLPKVPYTSNGDGTCQQNEGHVYINQNGLGYCIEQFCKSGSRSVREARYSARECWDVLGGIVEGIYMTSKYYDLTKKTDPTL